MADASSDDFLDLSFSFSQEELARIDASVETALQHGQRPGEPSHSIRFSVSESPLAEDFIEPAAAPSQTTTVPLDDSEDNAVDHDVSFASATFELNISTIDAEELQRIDATTSRKFPAVTEAAIIQIELEDEPFDKDSVDAPRKSPLELFRSRRSLSVTDLCAPSWCEVQYDYGLHGKRFRPIALRPQSFVSSSGKIISPEVSIAQRNDTTTKQGLTVHKELEREIKYEELQVKITTEETRWALRLVNMIACLRGIMTGFTREMPVFGILQDEVVVGIMDEVVKKEFRVQPKQSPRSKRPSNGTPSGSQAKRTKTGHKIQKLDQFFTSPGKTKTSMDLTLMSIPELRDAYTLCIKDNKTRKVNRLPEEGDTRSGRLQLMIYRKLLSELVTIHPPYEFSRLWNKLGLDSTKVFPTQFLVQAKLIEESDQFTASCLDDLVKSWNTLIKEFNIAGVDPQLELVYRLRPSPPDRKGKRRSAASESTDASSTEDEDLAKAIAASLQDVGQTRTAVTGPSNLAESAPVKGNTTNELSDSEDAQLQSALQQSMLRQSASLDTPNVFADATTSARPFTTKHGKSKESGIHRYEIIGTKKFLYNELELDNYLTRILQWWRGQRKPEGVSIEQTYRCRTCEYAEDCEWRSEKALEFSNRLTTRSPKFAS